MKTSRCFPRITAEVRHNKEWASQQVLALELDVRKDKVYKVETIRNSLVYNKVAKG